MKKLITICLLLLGVAAQAQNQVVTATTVEKVRKNVVRGNSANYGFGMINDTLTLVGLNSLYRVALGDNNSIQNRTLTLSAGTGVLITGGTQNLTENRTWTISLPQSVSTSASPTFVGITLTGNQNIGGDLTVTGNANISGVLTANSLFALACTISNNTNSTNYTKLNFSFANSGISASDTYFDYVYKGAFGSIQSKRIFTIKLGSVTMPSDTVRIDNLFSLSDIPDVRAAINAKLNTSTAASTYVDKSNNQTILGVKTFASSPVITPLAGTGNFAKIAYDGGLYGGNVAAPEIAGGNVSNTEFDYIDGVTSSIQTQLNTKLSTVSLTSNVTGILPVANGGTGISSFGTGIATFLGTPSSANLASALTDETGIGNVVFSANSTFTGTTNIATIANTLGATFATSSGNVGVGTIAPSKKFVVSDNGNIGLEISPNDGSAGYNRILSYNRTTSAYADFLIQTAQMTLSTNTATPIILSTNSSERVRIDASGNVGIGGTANASAILDLQSTNKGLKLPVMTATQASAITGTAGLMVYVTDTNGTFTSVGFWGYTTSWQKLNN